MISINLINGGILPECSLSATALQDSSDLFYSSYHGFLVHVVINCSSAENVNVINNFLEEFKNDLEDQINE
jgi:hypothetical protein